MDLKCSHWVECDEDGVLAVHRAQPGKEIGGVILASMYTLMLAVNFFSVPFIVQHPMSAKQMALCWAAALGTLVAGPALAARVWVRAIRGAWIIDSQGTEFRPRRGQPCRLAWKEVRWVRWGQGGFVLRGDGRRIALDRGFLDEEQWKPVRERVESLLSGRFDLMIRRPPEQPFQYGRVLAVSVPLGLATVLLMVMLASFSSQWASIALLAYLVLTVATMRLCLISFHREHERLNPIWRPAKPKPGDWEDWPPDRPWTDTDRPTFQNMLEPRQ